MSPFGEAFGNDVRHFLADEFVAAVAELFFRLHVEQNDFARLVDDYHRVRCRFEQAAVPAFHSPQMLFRGPAYADISNRRGNERALGAFERAEHDLDRKFGFVFA